MTYQGSSLGAFNTFRREPRDSSSDEQAISQAFADIATMTIVHSGSLDSSGIVERLREALTARVVIEQAKGVLAQQFHLTVGEAYDVLASRAATESYTVTALARSIVDSTHNS